MLVRHYLPLLNLSHLLALHVVRKGFPDDLLYNLLRS